METKTIKIDEKLHKELKLYCVKNDVNIKNLIENLLAEFLEKNKNKNVSKN
jgi:hypothetical protein